jgi:hypothetical protein
MEIAYHQGVNEWIAPEKLGEFASSKKSLKTLNEPIFRFTILRFSRIIGQSN